MAPVLPISNTEKVLLKTFQEVLGTSKADFGVETNLIQWGVTSLEIIKLKGHLQYKGGFADVPLTTIISNPTARSLSRALAEGTAPGETYNPTVVLQSKGKKVALWLFHPDNGEILVLCGLAKNISDRPVYALRARGFNAGEPFFSSIADVVNEYHKAIKSQQPHGPYALAGFEFGSLLAFELAKVLRANGDEVRFLGIFNSPPYSTIQPTQIDWSLCLLDLAVSLGLLSKQHKASVSQYFPALAKGEAVQHIQHASDPTRMAELYLTGDTLADWADVAFSLKKMAAGYQVTGKVDSIDVFCGEPRTTIANDRKEWRQTHLSRWAGFGRDVVFYENEEDTLDGIFGLESGAAFQKTFSKVLQSRGL